MEQMVKLRTHWDFVKNFQIGSSLSSKEIIFVIEPPLLGEDKVLYDDAMMTSNIAESLSNAMK
jgi:hypothetical protein